MSGETRDASAGDQIVSSSVRKWRDSVIDLSKGNNLLYFRETKSGSLDLSNGDVRELDRLFNGIKTPLSALLGVNLSADEGRQYRTRLKSVERKARAYKEEKGVDTLYLGCYFVSWQPPEGKPRTNTPTFLLPVELGAGKGEAPSLDPAGLPVVNPAFLYAVQQWHGWTLRQPQDAELESQEDLEQLFQQLSAEAPARLPEYECVQRKLVLACFAFQKLAILKDLTDNERLAVEAPLVRALAGEPEAQRLARGALPNIEQLRRDFDNQKLAQDPLVFDADSSQQAVIAAVGKGASVVVEGPPGTGKSQTIANLIGALAALNQRVLFVAEKRAALEVVLDRLRKQGLDALALDLHGAERSTKDVVKDLDHRLESVKRPPDGLNGTRSSALEKLEETKRTLVAHDAAMHQQLPIAKASVYQLQGQALRCARTATTDFRWRGQELVQLGRDKLERLRALLQEGGTVAAHIKRTIDSPWLDARLATQDELNGLLDLIYKTTQTLLPNMRRAWRPLADSYGGRQPETLAEAERLLTALQQTLMLSKHYKPELLSADLAQLEADLAPADRSWFASSWAILTNPQFRAALVEVRSHSLDAKLSPRQTLAVVRQAQDCITACHMVALTPPATVDKTALDTAQAATEALADAFRQLAENLPRLNLEKETSLAEVDSKLLMLTIGRVEAANALRASQLRTELIEAGASGLLKELESRLELPPEHWESVLEFAWATSHLESCSLTQELARFSGEVHDHRRDDFAIHDKERAQVASERILRRHAEAAIAAMNAHPEQENLIRGEVNKKRRLKPLRTLLQEAPEVLQALCPCWMASPLTVSELLPAQAGLFDVVIFDEASQIFPQDAVPAIMRGKRLVIAGDTQQLPPTSFFRAGLEEDGDEGEELPSEGFDSLLGLAASYLPALWLEWHYRSRDESLISFSNRRIYGERLVTFPGIGGASRLSFEAAVGGAAWENGESASAEVHRVVQLALEHANTKPNESLGIIAFGTTHANRIQAALDRAIESSGDLAGFFSSDNKEPFFVKNLERVQGDERDAIILSVGYCRRDAAGRLAQNFGPINQEGGEKRLNVAISRARERIAVVASFQPHEVDPTRSSARGVELLRRYLEYAASQGNTEGDGLASQGFPESAFEADVMAQLESVGIQLVPQLGVSTYRLDFAVRHPERPSEFVLAIECDGASYHSAYTARERDRLRQEHLEALGWRFHRIWSTEWFHNRDREITRVKQAYNEAVRRADQRLAGDRKSNAIRPQPERPNKSIASSNKTLSPSDNEPSQQSGRHIPRPITLRRHSINEYSWHELIGLLDWITSDGQLRTDAELLLQLNAELGFKRMGSRIKTRLEEAIRQWHRRGRS